jgi:hypothetical protein
MFTKGLLLKVIFGSLVGLAAATGYIFIAYIKPLAPTLLDVTIPNNSASLYENCGPIIHFHDNSQNEAEFRVYRRNLGASAFTLIHILPPSAGMGTQVSFTDLPLPLGTYQYKVSAYNQFGESSSGVKQGTVVWSNCFYVKSVDPSTVPLNPIIVSLSIINDCSVRISYRDNSTNEQGFKIYRMGAGWSLIKVLGPHTGIPGIYNDNTKLPIGLYIYQMIAYNQNGEADSNYSTIEVNSVCNPDVKALPTGQAPLVLPTLQKLSAGSCTWQAAANVFLLKGPGVGTYPRLTDVEAGQGFPVIGQSEDGQFWAVEVDPGVVGYVTKSENYSLINGDCSNVPPLTDPAPPVVAPTPTKKPGGKNNGAATPCPVGAVCP